MTTLHKAMLIQARDWIAGKGEIVFAGCGMAAVDKMNALHAALQAAIDAPEPEPVAHIRQTYIVGLNGELLGVSEKKELRFGCGNDYAHCTPLYTRPPAVRKPLTQERAEALAHRRCKRYVFIDDVPYQFDAKTLMDFVRDVEGAKTLTFDSYDAEDDLR